jgi:hypothetical protein
MSIKVIVKNVTLYLKRPNGGSSYGTLSLVGLVRSIGSSDVGDSGNHPSAVFSYRVMQCEVRNS